MEIGTGQQQSTGAPKAVAIAAATAGTLDITAAFISYAVSTGKNPVIVLNYIASGVFGQDAYADGFLMPVLGLTFHYFIASSWTILFFFAYPKIKILSKNKFVAGIVYGSVIWLVMSQVILPRSNVHQFPFNPVKAIEAAVILMVCVGLPIATIIGRYYSKNSRQ